MINKLKQWLDESNNIVFFGGAGVSTESGIPDFRSIDGLYNENYKYPPETILSNRFFHSHTDEFYKFYKDKLINLDVKPNFAHEYLVELEKANKLKAIVTQNIDNLHYQAGSKTVYELHGNAHKNNCMLCNKFYSIEQLLELDAPYCDCSGLIKPNVVLYGEGLNNTVIENSINAISEADMLIIAGTSLVVQPAASFVEYYKGNKLVVINKTPLSIKCDLLIEGAVGETFKRVSELK